MDRLTKTFTEERIVRIDEINMSEHFIKVSDQFSTPLRISMQFHDPLTAIPNVGERWIVQRRGIEWFLSKRSDTGQEKTDITSLEAGDRRIEGSRLLLNVTSITKNGFIELQGTAAPTSGTWKVGDKVWNTNPAPAGYIGWICTTAGTPGIWKGFGLIAT